MYVAYGVENEPVCVYFAFGCNIVQSWLTQTLKYPTLIYQKRALKTDRLILNCNGCNRKCYFNLKIKGAWVSLLLCLY